MVKNKGTTHALSRRAGRLPGVAGGLLAGLLPAARLWAAPLWGASSSAAGAGLTPRQGSLLSVGILAFLVVLVMLYSKVQDHRNAKKKKDQQNQKPQEKDGPDE